MIPTRPLIKDAEGDFSGCCPSRPALRDLDKIHRTLPSVILDNNDIEVLQDEAGFAILDEQTAGFIYDDLKR